LTQCRFNVTGWGIMFIFAWYFGVLVI